MEATLLSEMRPDNADTMSVEKGFYYTGGRSEMMPFLPRTLGRLLDVGCGAGSFGVNVKERYIDAEVWGVEPCAEAAARAGNVLDRVLTGTVEEHITSLPEGFFDVVSFNDVLEHLVDPSHVLRLVQPILAHGGLVVASLPNLRFFRALKHLVWDGDFRYVDYGIFDRTHLRFFTKKSIPHLFEAAGYEVVQIGGINPDWPRSEIAAALLKLARTVMPSLRDTSYLQFACVARPISDGQSGDCGRAVEMGDMIGRKPAAL